MSYTHRSSIPLAITALAVLASTVACTNASSGYPGASVDAMALQRQAQAAIPPGLYSDRAFDLGSIVVDGMGMTIYRYDKDSSNPPRSNCDGDCAQTWTPVRSGDGMKIEGIDQSLVGAVTRSDGSDQVTLAGWPLYRYTKDEMPGETAGQAINGAWYPITPTGQKVMTAADPGKANVFGL
ncbi:MAG TPA: hypothetical protein VJT49_21415 [Amycolatopsis sp.]|uniref:hypothetical protein n=1 Tax=Amycolatopsis sp. TaxID=37632 RepID=UPI002B47D412|nr:hypothetical protein [Amycolatopsis sp.]HKS47621.1 hypothetical protein [Amycolatopsis sp.]